MRLVLLVVFTLLPLAELYLLVKFGQWAGLFAVFALILGTAVAGAVVLQRQGLNTMLRTQQAMMRGETPVRPMIEGMMVGMAGVLLITPGLIGDVVGALLLVPPIRRFVAARLLGAFFGGVDVRVDTFESREPPAGPGPHDTDGKGPIIEGEFERLDERTIDPSRDRRDTPR